MYDNLKLFYLFYATGYKTFKNSFWKKSFTLYFTDKKKENNILVPFSIKRVLFIQQKIHDF